MDTATLNRTAPAFTASQERLDFVIERRGDTYVLDWSAKGGEGCRPAGDTEVTMWNRIGELDRAIVRQANAARNGMDAAHAIGRDNLARGLRLQAENSPAMVDSEKAANAILTAENDTLTRQVEQLQRDLAAAQAQIAALRG